MDINFSNWKFGDPGFINIRGTNGTGKSTIIKKYLTPGAVMKHFDDLNCHYYDCGTHYIVGRYETDCGGLDGVRGTHDAETGTGMQPYEAGQKAIIRLSKEKTTFAEGLIYGTTWKGSHEVYMALKEAGAPYFWFSIDISPEEVFDSVLKRRVSKGNFEPLNTANVAAKFRPVLVSHNKAIDEGIWTLVGNREEVAENIHNLVNGLPATKALGQKCDIEDAVRRMKVWTDKGAVTPSPEMIEKYGPKKTTFELGGFFA